MVSTPVQVSEERAFALLEEFLRQNFDAIAKHFPQPSLDVEGQANAPAE
jgi:hypothetical protein